MGATHRALFTVNLPYRATACYLLFVGGPTYQGSQSFICAGGYTQRARLSVVSYIVHGFYLSHAARAAERETRASRRYEADFILPHTLSHYIITRCHPAVREREPIRRLSAFDRRTIYTDNRRVAARSILRSPEDRDSFGLRRLIHPSPRVCGGPCFRPRRFRLCATRISAHEENAHVLSQFNRIDTSLR